MEYEDRHVTATPEGIRLDVVLAGLGSRFAAYAVDVLLQVVALILYLVVVSHIVGSGASETAQLISAGATVTFILLDFVGYFIVCEMLFNGRSPGKRLTGLRVVRVGGQPVGFLASALRNVLRLVDFLPTFNILGSLLILSTTRNQRLGDLAAGTIVIRDKVAAELHVGGQSWASGTGFAATAGSSTYWAAGVPGGRWLPPELAHWDVSAVPAEELALARTFVANRSGYTPAARQQLALQLANRMWPYVAGPTVPPQPEAFLEMVIQVKGARG
ncbi:MAG: RDD family protein [Acidimicrobiales bacterium]